MKLDGIKCDCCGRVIDNIAALHWESRPSVFTLKFPRDGVNGGDWSMDVCQKCRHVLFDAIRATIDELRHTGKHSIHCSAYCGVGVPFDDERCDCGATSIVGRQGESMTTPWSDTPPSEANDDDFPTIPFEVVQRLKCVPAEELEQLRAAAAELAEIHRAWGMAAKDL